MTIDAHAPYFEDLQPGTVIDHRRGHTVSTADNQMLSLMTLNTAQTHFNEDSMRQYMDGAYPSPLLMAIVAMALAVGLTTDDISPHAYGDRGYRDFTMPHPVFVGDTMYASSEIVDALDVSGREDLGEIVYKITAKKSDGTTVVVVTRHVLIKRRSHWFEKDKQYSESIHRPAEQLLNETAPS